MIMLSSEGYGFIPSKKKTETLLCPFSALTCPFYPDADRASSLLLFLSPGIGKVSQHSDEPQGDPPGHPERAPEGNQVRCRGSVLLLMELHF